MDITEALSEEHMKEMYSSFEAPGSEILKYRQMGDTPEPEYLMHLQGFFSGKSADDLDSVPGYYGGTASYQFVQNAYALNQHRVLRHLMGDEETGTETISGVSAVPPTLQSHLTPSAARIEAYEHARNVSQRPELRGPPRGFAYKMQGAEGANRRALRKGSWKKNKDGEWIYTPGEMTDRMFEKRRRGQFKKNARGDWVWSPDSQV